MSQIFRASATERLDAPEQLDRLLRTTKPGGWVAIGAVLALVTALASWSVVARIPDQITGRAAVVAPDSITPLYATQTGYVTEIVSGAGHAVDPGDAVVDVSSDGPAGHVTSSVTAFEAGQVSEIMVRRGERVSAGQQVAVLTDLVRGQDQRAYMFVGPDQAARLRVGMTTQVSIDGADQEVYGTVPGRVAAISSLPLNPQAVQATLQSVVLASTLPAAAGGTPYLVTIELSRADTPSGLRWALGSGPGRPVLDGSLASVRVTLGDKAPIDYLVRTDR